MKRLTTFALAAISTVAASSFAVAAEYTARIGHLESVEQTRHVHLLKVADMVKERTDGAVEFQIFPQGQLGTQREMTEGVQMGVLEATVAPAGFLGGFNPAVSVLDIPYLYPSDPAKAQALRGGEFGKALLETFNSKGVVGVTLWPNGWKHMASNKPLNSVEDFKGQKFRVMDSRILIEQFNALGASAVALPFNEVYTSLQTGVVDGQENPMDTILKMKFFEVQDNILVSGHGAFEDVVLFNPMFWDSLPAEYKTVITDAFNEVIPQLITHKTAAADAALEEIKKSDTNIIVASDEMKGQMREVMYPAARDAFLERSGDEGANLIAVYEKEFEAVAAK
ncbi:TRAP transporter substrate-binding protein [Pseudovibrio flavus]|uniref:TRAP transporter substrate-binding protein n=1 Tax=Pseudovibrio flavus TaxID=2529854 RepID=UPI00211BCFEE|nr:TRAP transporter substrate-binding protein [Pseudovibrio flavus]